MNKVSIISKMMNFTELYSMINIIDIYQEKKSGPRTKPCGTPYFGKIAKKMDVKFF